MTTWRGIVVAATLCLTSLAAHAEPVVRTGHRLRLASGVLDYRAEAGRIDIETPGTGAVHARMFFVAYRVATRGRTRPVTFLWNGGPGAPSATLHFTSIGPRRLEGGRLVDNADTLLPVTDLVFVDAVGTGFSRVTAERFAPEFYNTLGDVEAFAAFVRQWRRQFDATRAPVVLVGESFGAARAAGVAQRLLSTGERVDAVSLVSGGLGLGPAALPAALANALRVPEWAAIAMRHGKGLAGTGVDVATMHAEALRWATEVYAPALARVGELRESERTAIADALARYTGIAATLVDRASLVVTPRLFRTELLRDRGQTLPLFDLRRTAPIDVTPAEAALFDGHLRRDLRYATALSYAGLASDSGVNERWDYFAPGTSERDRKAAVAEAVRVGGGPPGVSEPWIRQGFALNPRLRVHVATGRFDAGQCLQIAETIRRLESPLRQAYTAACYDGGHMMYLDDGARVAFAADLTALIREVAP